MDRNEYENLVASDVKSKHFRSDGSMAPTYVRKQKGYLTTLVLQIPDKLDKDDSIKLESAVREIMAIRNKYN